MTNPWIIAIVAYVAAAGLSFLPVLAAIVRTINREDVEKSSQSAARSFDQCPHFDDRQKKELKQHFDRLAGTLVFWKFAALKFKGFHYYFLIWTIPSAVLIPILTQAISDGSMAKHLVTVVSAFTAVLLAFHRGFKIEDNHKAFRHGESEFYDLFRRLLDRPHSLGDTPEQQIDKYFGETETIRRFVRNAETNNLATLDEAKQMLQGKKPDSGKGPAAGT